MVNYSQSGLLARLPLALMYKFSCYDTRVAIMWVGYDLEINY